MTANQEAISNFRHVERVGPTKIYRCCECKKHSRNGLDMSPTDDGKNICNDGKACERRQLEQTYG